MMGQNGNTDTQLAIRKQLQLDRPSYERYFIQLNQLSPISIHSFNSNSPIFWVKKEYNGIKLMSIQKYSIALKMPYLGRSLQNQEEISYLLWTRFQATFILAVSSILIASLVGIFLGILAAKYPHTFCDTIITIYTSLGISIPSFLIATIFALFFGYYFADITGLNFKGSLIEYSDIGEPYWNLKNLVLPLLALSWRPMAIITQMTRNSMLEVMREDYIRTALAKGLNMNQTFWKHGLVNALNPILTSISGWLGSLLAGTYFIEIIFDYKGLGALTVQSIMKYDTPVILGASLYIVLSFIFITIIVDWLYRLVDPRVKLN